MTNGRCALSRTVQMTADQRASSSSPLTTGNPRSGDDVQAGSNEFIEPDAHSFVINIWFEKTNASRGDVLWRGRITHVASGKICNLTHLSAITHFIAPFLHKMGVRPTLAWRLRRLMGLESDA